MIKRYKSFTRELSLKESHANQQYYMFFSNLENMKRKIENILSKDYDAIDGILKNGHDWAADHVAAAMENITQVEDFLMNEMKSESSEDSTPKTMMISKPIQTLTKTNLED
jgi:hypothetical protein